MAITFPRLSGSAWRQIALWSIFLTLIGCKSTDIASNWTAQPMQIDGSASDWHNIPLTFFEDERISVGLANDSADMYMLLRTSNVTLIRGIRRAGITLWLDAKGGKDKKKGIFYQGGPDRKEMEKAGLVEHNTMNATRIGDRPFMKNMPNDSMPHVRFSYIDKSYYLEKNIDPQGTFGPAVAVGIEDGFAIYEFKIPLSEAAPESYGMTAVLGQKISIGAEWQEMDMNNFHGRPPGDREGRPGGEPDFPGGGFMQNDTPFGGGGMRPGGMQGGRREGPSMDKKDIWIKVQLALPTG